MPTRGATTVYATGTTSASKVSAPGAGLRIEVLKIQVSCATASALFSALDGSGGTTMAASIPGQTGVTLEGWDGKALFTLTANTALYLGASTGAYNAMVTYRVV